jgi:predicted nucleotidyltransferase
MYTERDISALSTIIRKDIPSTVRIILFGSYARGTANEESDMDFIILTGRILEREEKLTSLTVLRWEAARNGFNADFIVKNETDFLSEQELPTLARVISREGVVLWSRG